MQISPYRFYIFGTLGITLFVYYCCIFYLDFNKLHSFLIAITAAGFCLMGFDKGIAGKGTMRVPEIVFFLLTAFGGGLGILMGMYFFRHKTKKVSFQFWIGIIIIAQLALYASIK